MSLAFMLGRQAIMSDKSEDLLRAAESLWFKIVQNRSVWFSMVQHCFPRNNNIEREAMNNIEHEVLRS